MRLVMLLCFLTLIFTTKSPAISETEQDIINDSLHPVLKFQKLGVEPVLASKDDLGLAPLMINPRFVDSKYWNMKFETYHYQLQNLFNYELKGHKSYRGIHFPHITRFYQASIEFNHESLSVRLADDSFNTICILGSIDFKKQGWDSAEGFTFCRYFLDKYVLVDHIYTHYHGKAKISHKNEQNKPYWTIVDDFIFKHVTNIPKNSKLEHKGEDGPRDEVIRQIGEFFKWRTITIEFIRDLSPQFLNEIAIRGMFERKLIDEIHLTSEVAQKYSAMMTLKNAYVIMLMQTVHPDNTNYLTYVFDQFVRKGLIPDSKKHLYMDYF